MPPKKLRTAAPLLQLDETHMGEFKFLVDRLSRQKLEDVLLNSLCNLNLDRGQLVKNLIDSLPGPLRVMRRKRLEVSTLGVIDRSGMGILGRFPIETIVGIFNHLPFRERLKAMIFVSKGFLELMHEKALWGDVESSIQIDGAKLAEMISPRVPGKSLLPVGSIKRLGLDLENCSPEQIIQILRRIHLQGHTLTALRIKGTRKKMDVVLATLLKQAQGPRTGTQINLSQIIEFSICCDYNNNSTSFRIFRTFLETMPKLAHLNAGYDIPNPFTHIQYQRHPLATLSSLTEISRSGELLGMGGPHAGHNYLKTLFLPSWSGSLSALEKLGLFFPELESFTIGMLGMKEGENAPMAALPKLRFFQISGYNACAKEDDVSGYFTELIAKAPAIEEITFLNYYIGGSRIHLFKAMKTLHSQGKFESLKSPELRRVTLGGYVIDIACLFGEKKIWDCPKLMDGRLKMCIVGDEVNLEELGVWRWLPGNNPHKV